LAALIKNLEKMSWIRAEYGEKKRYRIVDPVVEKVLRERML